MLRLRHVGFFVGGCGGDDFNVASSISRIFMSGS